ncbi:MAG: hypothetical protein ACREMU_14565, partial [Gemmatimonadaceae bacterium]
SLPLRRTDIGAGAKMQSFRRIVLETGIAGGLLFVIHASIPYVYSWPMIWPALAGATAFWLATRESQPHRLATGLAAALATGVIMGAIAFVGLSTVIYVVLHTDIFPAVRQSGASRGLVATSSIIAIAASFGAIDLIIAFLAGLVTLPVRYAQTRRAHA